MTVTSGSALQERYDVVVVGGGAAGLSGALALARARRRVLVLDAGDPRNAPADGVHNYLTREGTPPADLLAAGRAEVLGYGGEVVAATALSARRLDPPDGDVEVALADGRTVRGRRLLVTTGLHDELPDVPGVAERWGRDVLHCPYCHGWEVRDQALGVLGTGPLAVHQALLWRQWSDDVTLLRHTGPAPTVEESEQLAARGVRVVDGTVAGLDVESDRLRGVRLHDGRTVPFAALAVAPHFTARSGVLESLGLEPTPLLMGDHEIGRAVAADGNGATAVPGVWVAGNVTDLRAQVIVSAAAGLTAGAAINADLVLEETRLAVAAARSSPVPEQDPVVAFWEEHYGRREQVWSGRANPVLVDVAEALPAGTALDLGCGEGGDTVWLAQQGWRVTGVDLSPTALSRAAAAVAAAGLGDRVLLERHDLARSFPAGTFDLVSVQYLHSPVELPREAVLRAAAGAVAPGGLLLVVGHAGVPSWVSEPHPHADFPTAEEVLASLELPDGEWAVERLGSPERETTSPDGQVGTIADSVVAVRRLAA